VMYLDPTAGQYVALHRANTFDAGQRALYGGHFAASGHISDRCLSTKPATSGWQLTLSLCGNDDDDNDVDDLDDCFDDDDSVSGTPITPGPGVGFVDDDGEDDFDDGFDDDD
jgi:hypothetical protein